MNVDIHLHTMPEALLDILDGGSPLGSVVQLERNSTDGKRRLTFGAGDWSQKFKIDQTWFDVPTIIRDLDRMQLDVVALSILPWLCLHWAPVEIDEWGCRAVNDCLAEMVRARPDRFVALANVPLQAPERAVVELERAVGQLGLRGLQIPSHLNGRNLDEPEFFPFFQRCQELDVPIFIHPFFMTPLSPVGKGRLGRYETWNFVGNPMETTIAAASLIFGGVLERLPDLKVVLAHAGGVLPYLIGRFDHGFGVRAESKTHLKERPSESFARLYFDTIAHSPEVLAFLVDLVGSDRVVIGTDYPADMALAEPVARVQALPLSRGDRRKILGGNLETLLKLA